MLTRERAAAEAASKARAFKSVALVVGSTGIVGAALVEILPVPGVPAGPWKVYALSRRPLPPWSAAAASSSSDPDAVVHLQVDLYDTAAVAKALAPLAAEITHVFYTAWFYNYCWSDAEACQRNHAMLRNVLSAVVPTSPRLLHVSLLTCSNQLGVVDPFEPVAEVTGPYSEDLPRPRLKVECHDLENALHDGIASRGGAVTWSVHRPTTIFGFSPRSARNVVSSLCVYAAICKKANDTLRWPGSRVAWHGFSEASDAELVGEQMVWGHLGPAFAKNKAFNCANGDVYKWQQLWPMLASHFGVEWSGYVAEDQRFRLEEAMVDKEALWAEIVREKGLVETELDDITNWSFVDDVISAEKEQLDTMNKCKEHGFFGFRNTVRCFDKWIRRMKADRIVP
ncbi:hypothetical protein BS78_01G317400 [Paspalum vaginatum]|nr:hypothetical protein BS78_01G317400 [Paspalum vaginatum]